MFEIDAGFDQRCKTCFLVELKHIPMRSDHDRTVDAIRTESRLDPIRDFVGIYSDGDSAVFDVPPDVGRNLFAFPVIPRGGGILA